MGKATIADLKADIAELKTEIVNSENRIVMKFAGILALFFVLERLFPAF